ncbi:MAG TPA: FAD-dependent thymidylate synthase [Candidatus Polarisedimenticolaceae bacterium]|nr:FAD-dependent thymidylate synthase [Candidatus Polarisedimenticolaceae bacterium]
MADPPPAFVESFSADERRALAPYFTNVDRPVFAPINLPEVVKGALFARYSRSAKSLRRLFLDEFLDELGGAAVPVAVGVERAERLYDKVFVEYGDDSVAQLGGVHLACENVSNVLTKILEWGRLMAYLEQSTRYVPYTGRPGGRFRYHVPAELVGTPAAAGYSAALDLAFSTYGKWLEPMERYLETRHPRADDVSPAVYRRTIRAKALDALRGLLPAATLANVGIFGTGQAYEALLLRMRANPLREVQHCAELMLNELREVVPAFLRRVDKPERGGRWSRYLADSRRETARVAAEVLAGVTADPPDEVTLSDFDPAGETKVVAAAMYAVSTLPDSVLAARARTMSHEERLRVLTAYVGDRRNRRHKPGRAFERTSYRFDVLTDYGAFRDLQRHRMLTLEWQALSPDHGYIVGDAVEQAGALDDWRRVMDACARVYHEIVRESGNREIAAYAVPMAHRVRFYMEMNAREAMHTIELRTGPQGHPSYRRVCQRMHRLIAEVAGHRAIADSMRYADHGEVELERLDAERAAEQRRGDG